MYRFSASSLNRMSGVHPDLIRVFEESIKVSPIDFGIPRDGGVRTAERQNVLYRDPMVKTSCDGYQNISRHQVPLGRSYGRALDFYAYLNGHASWDPVHLAMVAAVILSTANRLKDAGDIDHDIRWGGTFGSDSFDGWDMPHMELAG